MFTQLRLTQIVKDLINFIDLQRLYDEEVATRIEREKDIMQELDDEKYKLEKKIDYERTDKSLRFGEFRDDIRAQLRKQHRYVEDFQKAAMEEFQKLREELELEMDRRFDAQDEILDNMSNTIKTFQDTMKIVGSTVF